MSSYKVYCIKFTALPTDYVWYGTGNYTQEEAEKLASRFNSEMADTEVTVATIAERAEAQEDKNG